VSSASKSTDKKLTVKNGALTVTGVVSPAPTAAGAYVELLGRHTTKLSGGKSKTGKLTRLTKLTIKRGTTAFTIHARLTRGYHWQLETKYVRPGHKAGVSKLSSISVH
jgi:hypothetical protein